MCRIMIVETRAILPLCIAVNDTNPVCFAWLMQSVWILCVVSRRNVHLTARDIYKWFSFFIIHIVYVIEVNS